MQPPYDNSDSRNEWANPNRYVPALLVIAIGAIFLLNNLHIIVVDDIWQFWPAILIVWGAYKLTDGSNPGRRMGGIVMLAVGVVFQINNLHLLTYDIWQFWPVLLIGLGVMMLMDRQFLIPATYRTTFRPGATHKESAFLGGGRRVLTGDFNGAKFEAVFGGFEIDLRQATIPGDSAVLKVEAVFGGAEVKVPETWDVEVRGAGVFGAFTDSTHHPNRSLVPNVKRLIVRGSAVFGGVDIKN
jgi:predicted membrane protein